MTGVFLKLLNMSIAASWLVLTVMLLRVFLKKAPGWISCLLWGIVALRLVMPFSFQSGLSLIPSPEVIPPNVAVSETPAIYSGIPAVNSAVNPLLTQHISPGRNNLETFVFWATCIWLAGTVVLLLYSLVNYLKLRRQVQSSIRYQENIYLCDDVDSPFLLGIFRPRIYIPSGMGQAQLPFVLAHENAHLRRRDHWWKPLGFGLLTIYWFNPLLWAAYILLCRDIERACDEQVINRLDPAGKVGYSTALAACSVHRRMILVCPVAFGEVSVKTRIRNVLHYKKPTLWILCGSVLVCLATAVCFLTDPIPCSHLYEGTITVEPTCTTTGLRTQVCSHCRHSYTVRVDLTAHTYNSGVVTEASTCTHTGSKLLACTACGVQKTETIEMIDHIAAGTVRLAEPTCFAEGELGIVCSCCNTVFMTQPLPKYDTHDLQEYVLQAPTCLSPGAGVHICTRCGWQQDCIYEALGHTFAERWRSDATCMYPGSIRMDCTMCSYGYDIELPQKGHTWKYAGYGYKECVDCGWRMKTDFNLFSN